MNSISYVLGRSAVSAMSWYLFSILLIIDFVFVFLILMYQSVVVEIVHEFGLFLSEFIDGYFLSDLFGEANLRGQDVPVALAGSVMILIGAVVLSLIAVFMKFRQLIALIFISMIVLTICYVNGFSEVLSAAIALSIEVVATDFLRSVMLVLSLIVFVRSWRKYQVTA